MSRLVAVLALATLPCAYPLANIDLSSAASPSPQVGQPRDDAESGGAERGGDLTVEEPAAGAAEAPRDAAPAEELREAEAKNETEKEEEKGPASGAKIDSAKEWRQLFVLQLALPILVISAILFECCHFRFSYVDWTMRVEYPEELRRIQFTAIFAGACGWLREFIVSKHNRGTRILLLTLLAAFSLFQAYLKYNWTMWMGRWSNLLQYPRGNFAAFWPLLGNFSILVIVDTLVTIYQSYTEAWFILEWKTFMTTRFRKLWLSHRAFYLMELHYAEGDHMDNPDQRVSEDTTGFVDASFKLANGLVTIVLDLGIYVPMLWRLSPTSVFGLFDCKGWLLYLAVVWAFSGSMLTHLVGRILIALKYAVQRYEADYRFGLVSVRANSESIAMLGGEAAEENCLSGQWEHIRRVTWESMVFDKRYRFVIGLFNQMEWLISLIVLVPAYVQGDLTLSTLTMAQSALRHVKKDLEFVITSWDTLTSWRACVARLQTLEDRRTEVCVGATQEEDPFLIKPPGSPAGREDKAGPAASGGPVDNSALLPRAEAGSGDSLVLVRGLRIHLPSGQLMVTVDSFVVRPGDRVLVSGPVGIGKSSLMRTLSGIWPHAETAEDGELNMPNADDCLFVPRVPALPHVPLRDMVSYPELPGTYSDERVLQVLQLVGLAHLVTRTSQEREPVAAESVADQNGGVEQDGGSHVALDITSAAVVAGLDTTADWSKVLSGGEQQRAVIAHIILRSPRFLFLDEATSSMSQEASVRLYSTLLEALGPRSAVVTISHDVPGMRPLHSAHYAIDPRTRCLEEMPAAEEGGAAVSTQSHEELPSAAGGGAAVSTRSQEELPSAADGGAAISTRSQEAVPSAEGGHGAVPTRSQEEVPAAEEGGAEAATRSEEEMPAAEDGGAAAVTGSQEEMPAAEDGGGAAVTRSQEEMPADEDGAAPSPGS